MQFYLLGQDLWEIVGGSETSPPTTQDDLKKWKIRAGKVMYALSISVEDDLLQCIKEAKTPKEAWDTLAELFARTNDGKLQQLESELLSISQQGMTVSEYFTKVKTLCQEISKLDPENQITETRMRRIIIHGLRPEFNAFVIATRGWAKEPTLNEIENVLANQEALNKQMGKVSIKEDEKALFSNKRGKDWKAVRTNYGGKPKQEGRQKRQQRRSWQQGGARHNHQLEDKASHRKNDQCYNCGKRGHYARDCRYRRAEGNVATSSQSQVESEDEWGFQASCAFVEPVTNKSGEATSSVTLHSKEEQALVTVSDKSINYNDDWIVDSGCSNHMIGDKGKLSSMSKYNGERVVVIANNSRLLITHIGKTMVVPRYNARRVQLNNVFHVPRMKKNLISVP